MLVMSSGLFDRWNPVIVWIYYGGTARGVSEGYENSVVCTLDLEGDKRQINFTLEKRSPLWIVKILL